MQNNIIHRLLILSLPVIFTLLLVYYYLPAKLIDTNQGVMNSTILSSEKPNFNNIAANCCDSDIRKDKLSKAQHLQAIKDENYGIKIIYDDENRIWAIPLHETEGCPPLIFFDLIKEEMVETNVVGCSKIDVSKTKPFYVDDQILGSNNFKNVKVLDMRTNQEKFLFKDLIEGETLLSECAEGNYGINCFTNIVLNDKNELVISIYKDSKKDISTEFQNEKVREVTMDMSVLNNESIKNITLAAPQINFLSLDDGIDLNIPWIECGKSYLIQRSYDNNIWENLKVTPGLYAVSAGKDPKMRQCEKDYIDNNFKKNEKIIYYRYGLYKDNVKDVKWSDVSSTRIN